MKDLKLTPYSSSCLSSDWTKFTELKPTATKVKMDKPTSSAIVVGEISSSPKETAKIKFFNLSRNESEYKK